MSLELRREDLRAFLAAPVECYGKASPFVSPMHGDLAAALDPTKNPLFRDHARRCFFTVHRDGRVLGRILAHVHDASNRLHGMRRGCFAMFDCIDDLEVARALADAAEGWLREQGCDEVAGSFNLTITQMIGVVTAGFDEAPYTYMDWTPPHLPRLLAALGYEAFFPMRTYEIDLRQVDPEQLLGPRERALLADARWTFPRVQRRGLDAQLRAACHLTNDAFSHNPLFVPLTEEEFLFPCAGMTWIIDERIASFACEDGRPIGLLLCIPDLNPFLRATGSRLTLATPWHLLQARRQRRRAALVFAAVRQSHQRVGVTGVLMHRCLTAMKRAGYETLGVSWVAETNAGSRRLMQRFGARELQRLSLFRKPLVR